MCEHPVFVLASVLVAELVSLCLDFETNLLFKNNIL